MRYSSQDYLDMKTPLSYQVSEYDCGTTSILNGVKYLLKRGEIPAALVKAIELYTLDTYDKNKVSGADGTSPKALEFLSYWINEQMKKFNVKLRTKIIDDLDIDSEYFSSVITKGAVAVLRVWDDCEHYVLCTKVDKKCVYIFDPYYCPEDDFDEDSEVLLISNKPFEYNRVVSKKRLKSDKETFSLVREEPQIALLMYRD